MNEDGVESARGDAFRVVLLYDEAPAGRAAATAAELLRTHVQPRAVMRCSVWRADLLEYAGWLDQSLADAAVADFIIVASTRPEDLPELFTQWRQMLRARSPETEPVTVCLVDAAAAPRLRIEEPSQAEDFAARPNELAGGG